ncbi:MAG: DNA-processing protein DprA [Clostridia bacterium]|nr:DNA-processing protein DprA [Clostridia bacterium]
MQHETLWVALAEALGARSPYLKPLLQAFGTPEAIFAADEQALLAAVPTLGRGTLAALLRGHARERAAKIVRWCHMNRVRILTMDAPEYPKRLLDIDEPPAVLYCRGNLSVLNAPLTVGVVGTRKPDVYGVRVAYKLSFELAAAGAVIVSGMADGLDGVAAAAAINAGSATVAVFGSGIDIIYPKSRTKLSREIAEHGVMVTEYAPGTRPFGHNFPVRNRIISALSGAVLIAEAGETSGALITARYAITQGKPLFAVPGDITAARSAGTNQLVADGVTPVSCTEDVLRPLRFLYHDCVQEQALREAMQYSELSEQALRPFGMRDITALLQDGAREQEKVTSAEPKASHKGKTRKSVPAAQERVRSAPDLSMLDAQQKTVYENLPDGAFSVDALTERGIPVGEAAAALTLLEVYGLVCSRPGGLFEKL